MLPSPTPIVTPSAWPALPSCPATVSWDDVHLSLPELPDGQGMTLDDWCRVTRDRVPALTDNERDVSTIRPSPSQLCRAAERVQAQLVAHLLPQALPAEGWLGNVLTEALHQAFAVHIDIRRADLATATLALEYQELTVAMLLAAGAPITLESVGRAATCINPRLALRVLRVRALTAPDLPFVYTDDQQNTTPLHQTVNRHHWSGRTTVIDALLATGCPVDLAPEPSRRTPLMAAVINGDYSDLLQHLLRAGASPNHQDQEGYAPTHWAASLNHDDELVVLLDAGAEPTLLTHDQCSLLQVAAQNGAHRTIKVLLDRGMSLGPDDENQALALLNVLRQRSGNNPGMLYNANVGIALLEQRSLRASLATDPAATATIPAGVARRRL